MNGVKVLWSPSWEKLAESGHYLTLTPTRPLELGTSPKSVVYFWEFRGWFHTHARKLPLDLVVADFCSNHDTSKTSPSRIHGVSEKNDIKQCLQTCSPFHCFPFCTFVLDWWLPCQAMPSNLFTFPIFFFCPFVLDWWRPCWAMPFYCFPFCPFALNW